MTLYTFKIDTVPWYIKKYPDKYLSSRFEVTNNWISFWFGTYQEARRVLERQLKG